ncbi:MAG: hypothetical protein HYY08_02325 [Firmicutes bacterium]|nr:hypothetical protein [Bacillota bacterium]
MNKLDTSTDPSPRGRPRVRSVINNWFQTTYYEVLEVVGSSIVWLVLSLPLVTVPAATAGVFQMTHQVAVGGRARFSEILKGFRRHFVRTLPLVPVPWALVLIARLDWAYYNTAGTREGLLPLLFLGSGLMLALYTQVYMLPLFISWGMGFGQAVRTSAYLSLMYPSFTVGVFGVVLGVMVILSLPWFILPVLAVGPVGGFLNSAVLYLLKFHPELDPGTGHGPSV